MSNAFYLIEVVDMGIEKEKARRDFYGLVSKNFAEKEIKDLFIRLRDWEEAHIEKFTEIKNTLKESETTESYPGELKAYIKALVDDKLYKDVSASEFSKNIKTPLSAIFYGMGFEKDAIIFFSELARYVNSADKDVIEKLIDEERKHIVYLNELKEKLTAP